MEIPDCVSSKTSPRKDRKHPRLRLEILHQLHLAEQSHTSGRKSHTPLCWRGDIWFWKSHILCPRGRILRLSPYPTLSSICPEDSIFCFQREKVCLDSHVIWTLKLSVVFLAMMHNMRELWEELYLKEGIKPSSDKGSTIIIDNVFTFATTLNNLFLIVKSVCLMARKYNLTWKLKKCQWFPKGVEFVGVDISTKGNVPALSRQKLSKEWKEPSTLR